MVIDHTLTCIALFQAEAVEKATALSGYGWALFKTFIALIFVCVLAFVLLRIARRYLVTPRFQGSMLRVMGHHALSARQSLWVIEVAGRSYLLGATDHQITLLAELPMIKESLGTNCNAS